MVGGARRVALGGWRSVGGARQVAFGCWCRILKARNAYIIYQFHHRIRAGIRRQILGNSVVYKRMTSLCFATAHAQSTPSTPTPPAIVRQPTSTSVRAGASGTLLHCVLSTTRAVRSCSTVVPERLRSRCRSARCPAGNVTATIDGSVAFSTYVTVLWCNAMQKTYIHVIMYPTDS